MDWEDEIAEERVGRLLRQTDQSAPHVDIDAIAALLEIEVVYTGRLHDDVSGCLYYGTHTVAVGVNTRKPRAHQRFTVAHELAHFLSGHDRDLHLHVARDHETDDETREEERLANALAAALLMPSEWVRAAVDRGVRNYRLCHLFRVSPSAMARRLQELGLAVALTLTVATGSGALSHHSARIVRTATSVTLR